MAFILALIGGLILPVARKLDLNWLKLVGGAIILLGFLALLSDLISTTRYYRGRKRPKSDRNQNENQG